MFDESLCRFATHHPFQFSILITLLMLLFYTMAGVLAEVLSTNTVERNLISALGRGAGAIAFVFIIIKFGWQEASGFTRPGSPITWIIAFGILVYETVTHAYPLLGNVNLENAISPETISVALNAMATGPLEEISFRGVILYAFLRLWANTENGIIKSALATSLLFGASHLIHILLGRPLPQATLIAANAFMAGIYYAAIVIRWRTIWPPVAIHGLLNAVVAIVAFHTPGFQEPADILLLAVVLQVPVVIPGLYLISRARPRDFVLEAA